MSVQACSPPLSAASRPAFTSPLLFSSFVYVYEERGVGDGRQGKSEREREGGGRRGGE